MSLRIHLTTASAALMLSVGCTSSPYASRDPAPVKATGSVDGAILDTPSSDQYAGKIGESFLRPHKVPDNATPVYPELLLTSRLPPVEIRVRMIVSGDGVVTSTEPLRQENELSKPFLDAVVSAVSTWRFYPLYKIDAAGNAEKLPFHQDYSFTFTQIDGKGVVAELPGQR